MIKGCHIAMSRNRTLQELNNLLGATRFEMVVEGILTPACCSQERCGRRDSWEHFQECYAVPEIGELAGQEKVDALVTLRRQAKTDNPTRRIPHAWQMGKVEAYSVATPRGIDNRRNKEWRCHEK